MANSLAKNGILWFFFVRVFCRFPLSVSGRYRAVVLKCSPCPIILAFYKDICHCIPLLNIRDGRAVWRDDFLASHNLERQVPMLR